MEEQKDLIEKLRGYKVVVFDLDGTLVDLNVDWNGLKMRLEEYCQEKGCNCSFKSLGEGLDQIREQYGDGFYGRMLDIVSEFELRKERYIYHHALIDYINGQKHQKFVVYSMNTRKCVESVINTTMKGRIDFFISKESVVEPKPSPHDLCAVLQRYNLSKEDVVFVGNSEFDRRSGEMVGVPTVIVSCQNFHGRS